MLPVTGPVTRNMELALRKTYAATPNPKVWSQ
jgi:Ni,Fe-hydrogenase III small subunit